MGDPTILLKKNLITAWTCQRCRNTEEFSEDWEVKIFQDLDDKSSKINLVESVNIRCSRCGSYEIREVEI